MPVIAMTREMGSLGKDVAAGLAGELGIALIYNEIVDVLADKMRVRKSHVIKLLDGQANIFERLTADKTSMSIFTAAEVCALALREPGALFRGWGTAHLMRDIPHVVCVRICAPFELRKQRMLERLKTTDAAKVEEEIRASEEAQTALVRREFHTDWTDALHYDLVLNTECLTPAQCIDHVLRVVRSAQFAETPASRKALADLALKTAVQAALRSNSATRRLDIAVNATDGLVTLEGIVDNKDDRMLVERVTAAVPGAGRVNNALRAVSEIRARHA